MTWILLIPALLAAGALGAAYWRSRGGHPAAFTLVSIPCALLFFTIPVPSLIVAIIGAFQNISERPTDSVQSVADVMTGLARTLWWASVIAGAIFAACVVLHVLRSRDAPGSIASAPEETVVRANWHDWTLAALPMVVLPIAGLVLLVEDVPRLVMGRALDMTSSPGAAAASGTELKDLSNLIASRLVTAMLAGLAAMALNLAAVAAAIFFAGSARASERFATYSWAAILIVAAATTANAIRLDRDMSWIAARSQAAQRQHPTPHGSVSTTVSEARPADRGADRERRPTRSRPATGEILPGLLRGDGLYRSEKNIDGKYEFWRFTASGTCIPGSAPAAEAVFMPAPLPPGRSWTWRVSDRTLVLTYAEDGVVKRQVSGTIVDSGTFTLKGVRYRFQPVK